MHLPANKTKLVCTIGPASESIEVLTKMIRAGMNIARVNFSHGDFDSHRNVVSNIRAAAEQAGRRVAIMGDLPGPKMRLGEFVEEPVELKTGQQFTLSAESFTGDEKRVSMSFPRLPDVVKPGDTLFLNDGYIEIEVEAVEGREVHCRVVVEGELRSRKGLNLPDIDLGISAFTDRDHECLRFAAEVGLDAVSQSFVETASDIASVREAAAAIDYTPFIIAKIERSRARDNLAAILDAADGIMVARGDLGVEIPIEEIAMAQKQIIHMANLRGKPVITATQMLESMTANRRPTRAESTDVANAILDGTDGVMLSGESAMGRYPVDAVAMLARIAAAAESRRPSHGVRATLREYDRRGESNARELITRSVETIVQRVSPALVLVPSLSGATARNITRYRLPAWIAVVTEDRKVSQDLIFSYGILPIHDSDPADDWNEYARRLLAEHAIEGNFVLLATGPSPRNPKANNRIELIDLRQS